MAALNGMMQHQVLQPPCGSGPSPAPCIQRRPALCRRGWQKMQAASDGPSSSGPPAWFDNLNRNNIQGPPMPGLPQQQGEVEIGPSLMGEEGFGRWTEIKRSERQRVWDTMREAAAERYKDGVMPDWFNPAWLNQEESPINKMIREMGDPRYQYDDQWLGRSYEPIIRPDLQLSGDGGDNGEGGGRGWDGRAGGDGWWREDDPYWMMKDWGSHPMRWWTLGFAAVMAFGGLASFLFQGSVESLFIGWGGAVSLALCSLAMSDMRTGTTGELGVKAAWALCALLALKDGIQGWSHLPSSGTQRYAYSDPASFLAAHREPAPWDWLILKWPELNFTLFGWSAVAMGAMYMWTGMGGELDGSLPMNPGAVYKTPDIVLKHRVWKRWGYGDETMRV